MNVGFDHPLYILPFDHRGTFQSKMFGWKGALTAEQTAEIAAAKEVVYDGFKAALAGGVPQGKAGILVDEKFGTAILIDAAKHGHSTCCPAEKSGQDEFDFEYGEDFAKHIEAFQPTFCKVLVRYNPEGDAALNKTQAARLKRLADYLHAKGQSMFMFELLVPPEKAQLDKVKGDKKAYDLQLRPGLMVQAIQQLQDAGVEGDVWKIEGLERREDCAKMVAAARRPGQGGLHRAGPRRGRQEGPPVADDGGGRAGLHRLRRRPDDVLGPAGRLAREEDAARGGGEGDRAALPRMGGRVRQGARGVTAEPRFLLEPRRGGGQ